MPNEAITRINCQGLQLVVDGERGSFEPTEAYPDTIRELFVGLQGKICLSPPLLEQGTETDHVLGRVDYVRVVYKKDLYMVRILFTPKGSNDGPERVFKVGTAFGQNERKDTTDVRTGGA